MSALPTQLRSLPVPRTYRTRILVTDDDQDMREILAHALLHEGYDVVTAENGHEALKMIRQHQPALVLTDALMPGMDGRDLCQRIKTESPFTRVVLITALYTSARHKSEAFKNFRVDGFLSKPFDLELLLKTVTDLAGEA